MGINIGNNNKLKKSVIGNNNKIEKETSTFSNFFINILITIVGGLLVAYCIYKFGWNK